jgi:hypothetical protein
VKSKEANAELLELAAEWRNATDAERDRALASACAFAEQALASRPDRERVLAFRDPIPAAHRELIERLRRDASSKG